MNVPNLFIVGPPRSGTTSLIEWLAVHPDIGRPHLKEPMFHAPDLATPQRVADRAVYLAMYDELEDARYYVDATPWYLYSQRAAASIHDMSPDAHILINLRNPVQVLASLHSRHVLVGLEPEPDFATAVFDGRRRDDPAEFRRSLDYLAVGRFGEQAARFVELFPEGRVHFISVKDMAQRPRERHLELLQALGVEERPLDDYARYNEARTVSNRWMSWAAARVAGPRHSSRIRRALASRIARRVSVPGRAPLDLDVARRITQTLRADIELLQRVSGHDLSGWLER